ncbi:MAG TPA: sigma-54 dependent transcriptional regulator [Spirochaetia bacterium]
MKTALIPTFAVAIVDDEQTILDVVSAVLRSAGLTNLMPVRDPTELLPRMERTDVGVMLLDLAMDGLSGEELIPLLRHKHPDVPIVVLTGNHDVEKAVACMKAGVDDYLMKPVEPAKLVATVRRFVELQELRRENAALGRNYVTGRPVDSEAFAEILTADDTMLRLFRYVETIAGSPHPVLVTGETGVGKELMARALHRLSGREGAFVAVNVAGLDEAMFSDTLFGHRAGAFTSASSPLSGLIERASGGTLFLDEIGDLPPANQVKLLRLLESREFYPLGSDIVRTTDARVVVATNAPIEKDLATGKFRRDLYYRLRTHHVHIPPLRERPRDIPLLAWHFVEVSARDIGCTPPTLSPELLLQLQCHPFPGNIRELKSMIFDAVSRHTVGTLTTRHLADQLHNEACFEQASGSTEDYRPILTIKETVEKLIEDAMRVCGGNRTAAARLLGITPQALGQRLKKSSRH